LACSGITLSDKNPIKSEPRPPDLQKRRVLLFADFLARHERIFNVLSTTVTAIFTVVLATSTVFLWKETKDLRDFAQQQSTDMKNSIAEATRAAIAMENVAAAVAANAKAAEDSLAVFKDANARQLRAYLTVGQGAVIKQDTTTNYRFEVRTQAATYVGISPSLFDQMVRDGRMPQPKHINSRVIWDRQLLDEAFDALPADADEWAEDWTVAV
jgi:hypothetical protein